MRMRRLLALAAAGLVAAGTAVAGPAEAEHAWGSYHWGRTPDRLVIPVGDNVTTGWDAYLDVAIGDWHSSSVLDLAEISPGGVANPKTCKGTAGRVEICNAAYGFNQWLGIAQIKVSGSHITQGVVKMNDSYFNTSRYNTPAWRQSVMCQEIGHTLGLHHNDEDFATVNGTCMDYANDPSANQHPDGHDYSMLEQIYAHAHATTTVAAAPPAASGGAVSGNDAAEWGRAIHHDGEGRPSLFVRRLGDDERVLTFVTWA